MPTPPTVANRLRQIRQQQNLTLKQVEIRSRGKWKAVVVGSYERGSRSLSISRAQELCDFYGVPLLQLFSAGVKNSQSESLEIWRFDLRKLRSYEALPDLFVKQITSFISYLAIKRDDWNGEILTIRHTDIEIMQLLTQKTIPELYSALLNRNLVLKR
ncbi:MAG: helix-turn-helix domain-containing protein [Candidatus Nanopelagicaceae bacterium]|nr:helix-turn-helix domain-containing protein [Candidatus Nanopelagicaceae bacterium]